MIFSLLLRGYAHSNKNGIVSIRSLSRAHEGKMYLMSINIQNIFIHDLFSNITSDNFLVMTMLIS